MSFAKFAVRATAAPSAAAKETKAPPQEKPFIAMIDDAKTTPKNIEMEKQNILNSLDLNLTLQYHPSERTFFGSLTDWFKNTTSVDGCRKLNANLSSKTIAETFHEDVELLCDVNYDEIRETIVVSCFLFSAYQYGHRVAGQVNVGEHEADLEEIYIELTPDYKFSNLLLSAHGKFAEHKSMPTTIYAAKMSHALYTKPLSYLRLAGFGNDACGEGRTCKLIPKLLVDETILNSMDYLNDFDKGSRIDGVRARYKTAIKKNHWRARAFDKIIPEPASVSEGVTWLGHLGYAVLPLAVGLSLGLAADVPIWVPIVSALGVLIAQCYVLKLLLYAFAPGAVMGSWLPWSPS